jgi:large subunit ribosomal protein L29
MEMKEVKNLSAKELTKKVWDLKKDLFDLRMKNSLGQLSNPLQIRFLRKDIARVLNVLGSKKS